MLEEKTRLLHCCNVKRGTKNHKFHFYYFITGLLSSNKNENREFTIFSQIFSIFVGNYFVCKTVLLRLFRVWDYFHYLRSLEGIKDSWKFSITLSLKSAIIIFQESCNIPFVPLERFMVFP